MAVDSTSAEATNANRAPVNEREMYMYISFLDQWLLSVGQ